MSYFSRFGIQNAKAHVFINEFNNSNGRASGKAHEKRCNRRFVRRAGKKMIDIDC